MKKSVKLFGKSIPVWTIFTVVIITGASAAFVVLSNIFQGEIPEVYPPQNLEITDIMPPQNVTLGSPFDIYIIVNNPNTVPINTYIQSKSLPLFSG